MKVEKGANIYVLSRYLENLQVIKEIMRLEKRVESYVLLKPLVAQVRIKGSTLRMGIPAASVLTKEPLTSREPDLILNEDAWVDVKKFIESEKVVFSGNFMIEEFPFLSELRREGGLTGVNECSILDLEKSVGLGEYLSRLINTRHVLLTHSLKEAEAGVVKGFLKSSWTTHFILSGLETPSGELYLESYMKINEVPKLRILLKPLLSINEHIILGELPLNRSLVINYSRITDRDLKHFFLEILIRSLIYTC